ncbi:MAG: 2Fe-2S iron-sulfur cluster-binding protein, partial [Myxococcota bacterium]
YRCAEDHFGAEVMGKNPFIDADAPPPPTSAYTLRVKVPDGEDIVIPVDPHDLPSGNEGHVGSVLSILIEHDVDIDHTCGGVCACSTCHIYVHKGLDTSPDPIEEEEDQLDFAPAVQENSRLSCQFVPDGSEDVIVEIPAWNRNEVSEDH